MSDRLPLFDGPPEGVTAEPPDPDREARAFAQDPAENVVLEASAGTGKTTVLVARYVNLLARGIDPANILAITFTRKAAAEMRERIVRELRRAAAQGGIDKGLWTALRDRLGDIQISTIDAFCLSLLREFPLEADLDPGFSLADETEVPRLIDESLDRSLAIFVGLARRDPDIALVLAQLGMSRARAGMAHLLERRLVAKDVLDRFLQRGPNGLTSAAVCATALRALADTLAGAQGGLEGFAASGPLEHPKYALLARDLRRLDSFVGGPDAAVRALLDRVRDHFLKTDGQPRTTDRIHPYTVADYPDAAAGKRHRADVQRLGPAVADLLRRFARDLNAVLARGIRRMFAIAEAEYGRALLDRSVLDFSDVLHRAVELLRRMDEFSQSRYRLEGRYHHVLVDEFQDTSRKQWELVKLLVQAWGEGAGLPASPSIFIVGDRKQSIYRFRDADVTVLGDAGEFIANLRPQGNVRRAITRSFRAVPELLAFVNDVFAEAGRNPERADDFKYDDADRFPVGPDAQDARGPAIGLSGEPDAERSAAAVAAEIAEILRNGTVRDKQTGIARPATPGDIAILFRSRTSHREFEAALERRGIRTYVYKGLGFFDADEIKDVAALIRYLADPWSELRTAAFLRSRFVRLSDRALASLAPRLASAVLDAGDLRFEALEDGDRRVLAHARTHVPRWLDRVDRVPPADLVETLLTETAYAYELRGARRDQAWENLKKMRGLIRRIQNRGFATLARIADHLDSLTAGDESNAALEALDAVNLMTVHASKGLEFPVVFVVNIGRGANGFPRPVRVGGDDVSIGPFVSEMDEAERAREREETKRLLYVALTRARDRLYLAGVLKDGQLPRGARGSLSDVLPEPLRALFSDAGSGDGTPLTWTGASGRTYTFRHLQAAEAAASPARVATREGMVTPAVPAVLPNAGLPRVAVTAAVSTADEARSAARGLHALSGSLVHRLIADVPPHTPDPVARDYARRCLAPTDAASPEDLDGLLDAVVASWRRMIEIPELRLLFDGATVHHEVPFSYFERTPAPRIIRGTIDCLVERGEDVIVLELKTGAARPDHEQQLDLYVRAAKALYADRNVSGRLVYAR